jgi:hypothetical protein
MKTDTDLELEDAIWEAAVDAAWAELGGRNQPSLHHVDPADGEAIRVVATRFGCGACLVRVQVEDAAPAAAVLCRYTHGASELGANTERTYHEDAQAAIDWACVEGERLGRRSRVYEIYALSGEERTALVIAGELYRRAE